MHANEIASFGYQVLDGELDKSKKMIDSFIYSCSHGVRSPLKTMEGLVTLMKDYPLGQETDWDHYHSLLRKSAERLKSVLEHFQELRLNAHGPLSFDRIDLKQMTNDVIQPFQSALQSENIQVALEINQRGEFNGDPVRLETVLSRIISNAVFYHDISKRERSISIFITSSVKSCSIQVMDNGTGISTAEQGNIFNLFYRGTSRSSGAGMGLYVAKEIVKKMKGTISVKSAEGEGSVFSIWLPNQMQ